MTRSEFEVLATKIEKHMQYINKKKEQNAARSEDDYVRGMNRFNRLTKLNNAVIALATELALNASAIHDDVVADDDDVDVTVTVSMYVECTVCYEKSFKAIVGSNKRECLNCGHFQHYDIMFAPLYDCKTDVRELRIEDCII